MVDAVVFPPGVLIRHLDQLRLPALILLILGVPIREQQLVLMLQVIIIMGEDMEEGLVVGCSLVW